VRYVLRSGKLVAKWQADWVDEGRVKRSNLPTPMISRFESMESPVTGREITSWRDRDRDMAAAGCVDPRDLPRASFEKREEDNARRQQLDSVADATAD
jgi:hypothetical protein